MYICNATVSVAACIAHRSFPVAVHKQAVLRIFSGLSFCLLCFVFPNPFNFLHHALVFFVVQNVIVRNLNF